MTLGRGVCWIAILARWLMGRICGSPGHKGAGFATSCASCTLHLAGKQLHHCTSPACHLLALPQERYERLAGEEAARLAAKRAAKEAEVYGSLAFKPQLNPRSLALAPVGSGGVEALASADRQRRKLEELVAEEEARQRAECTFQVGVEMGCVSHVPPRLCGRQARVGLQVRSFG